MRNNIINHISLHGKIRSVQKVSTLKNGKQYWQFFLNVKRQSRYIDTLPIVVLTETLNDIELKPGLEVTVEGSIYAQASSKYRKESHLQVYVYATSIAEEYGPDVNDVKLEGPIWKTPTFRKTNKGTKLCDVMVQAAPNSDMPIPCLIWDNMAIQAARRKRNDIASINGMLQSRLYEKATETGIEKRMYYEVTAYHSKFKSGNTANEQKE